MVSMRSVFVLLFGFAVIFRATTYYIDGGTGNDAAQGTFVDQAWKSLEKVNATAFQPGDRILFASP
jgi:hypothetical protein